MSRTDPLLFDQISDYLVDETWLGSSIPPSEHLLADSVFDQRHFSNAQDGFDALWKRAKSV
jgi:hypothetical protein